MKRILSIVSACLVLFLLVFGFGSILPGFTTPINEKLETDNPSCNQEKFDWDGSGELVVVVSFAGGGKRAAAFAYGALLGLEKLQLSLPDGRNSNLLREVDFVHGVSGGATAGAYFVLTKDSPDKFHKFTEFLYEDTELQLIARSMYPWNWFQSSASIQASYFSSSLYEEKRFSALPNWPRLTISATDLSRARQFIFSRTQFACIGSDLNRYPIGHAVAASAAFPLVFGTLPLYNFDYEEQSDYETSRTHGQYLHLSDGGLTDNLAIGTIMGLLNFGHLVGDENNSTRKRAKALIWIRVDGSSHAVPEFEHSFVTRAIYPRMHRALDAVFEEQVRQLTGTVDELMARKLKLLNVDLAVFNVSFQAADSKFRERLLLIPTRWTLNNDQVDMLIKAGESTVLKSDSIERVRSFFQRYKQ